ncbi:shiftless antiviral inhibitor of ribosomal frameshifting protein homolog [Gigantopelta aegis]|uniref:shiftless antiviral inhibitor of ribosomal frameshifting protein homolog n=1 Tax=Gigantopelta aegis TaxID=1735272 RepID=UPI001B889C46|nr:shiftless antiviral inhibitor of ribosomal frameshifting protein homolog [Gigantopelta aegis]
MDKVSLRKEARKLQELFRGRFSEDEAIVLIREKDGIAQAVDFINKADPQVVRKYLMKCDKKLILDLQRDATKVGEVLIRGIDVSVRQFGCEDCDNSWWRKVPIRKEVSRCKKCRRKFDPVPREHEWGWARFQCACGHQFSGFGQMGQLVSPCYKCGRDCVPHGIIPPDGRRNPGARRSRQLHSCSGVDCVHRYVAPTPPFEVVAIPAVVHVHDVYHVHDHSHQNHDHANDVEDDGAAQQGNGPDRDSPPPQCVHPSTSNMRVRYPSPLHVSTGSTVNTFLSQVDDDDIMSLAESFATMPTIEED